MKEFREMRKVYHKRAMWSDRWAAGEVASTVLCAFFFSNVRLWKMDVLIFV